MEAIKAGSLNSFMSYRKLKKRPITDYESSIIIKQVLQAILHIHAMGIIHRDLKPQNVLLKSFTKLEGTIKVGDLGLGKKIQVDESASETEVCGTVIYMAPEIIFKQVYGKVIFLLVLLITK